MLKEEAEYGDTIRVVSEYTDSTVKNFDLFITDIRETIFYGKKQSDPYGIILNGRNKGTYFVLSDIGFSQFLAPVLLVEKKPI